MIHWKQGTGNNNNNVQIIKYSYTNTRRPCMHNVVVAGWKKEEKNLVFY